MSGARKNNSKKGRFSWGSGDLDHHEVVKNGERKVGELCYVDGDGIHDDRLHGEILNNPEAEIKIAEAAIKRAVLSGIKMTTAIQLYGIRGADYSELELKIKAVKPALIKWWSTLTSDQQEYYIDTHPDSPINSIKP